MTERQQFDKWQHILTQSSVTLSLFCGHSFYRKAIIRIEQPFRSLQTLMLSKSPLSEWLNKGGLAPSDNWAKDMKRQPKSILSYVQGSRNNRTYPYNSAHSKFRMAFFSGQSNSLNSRFFLLLIRKVRPTVPKTCGLL